MRGREGAGRVCEGVAGCAGSEAAPAACPKSPGTGR